LIIGALCAASWIALSPMTCIVAMTAAFAMCNVTLFGLNAIAVWRVTLRRERMDHRTATGVAIPPTKVPVASENVKG